MTDVFAIPEGPQAYHLHLFDLIMCVYTGHTFYFLLNALKTTLAGVFQSSDTRLEKLENSSLQSFPNLCRSTCKNQYANFYGHLYLSKDYNKDRCGNKTVQLVCTCYTQKEYKVGSHVSVAWVHNNKYIQGSKPIGACLVHAHSMHT